MFNKKILEAAVVAAGQVTKNGYELVPQQGSMLEGIVRAVYPLEVNQDNITEAIEDFTDGINNPIMGGDSLYTQQMKELIPMVAMKLNEHLDFARNVVVPRIKEVAEAVTKRLENTQASEIRGAKIVSEGLPGLVRDNGLVNAVDQWAADEINESALSTKVTLPALDEDTLKTYIQTGNSVVDTNLMNIVNENEGILMQIYNGLFLRETFNNPNVLFAKLRLRNQSEVESVAYLAVLVYLISSHMIKHIPEGVVGSSSELMEVLTAIRGQAALKIKSILAKHESTVATGVLIRNINGNVVTVNQDLYQRFLENGGSADAILGNTLMDTPYRTLEEIVAHQPELEAKWSGFARIVTDANSLTMIQQAQRVFVEVIADVIKGTLATHQGSAIPEANQFDNMIAKAREIIYAFPGKQLLNDIQHVATVVVCRTFFEGTDVEETLLNIQEATDKNPNLDPKEAALISAIRYVSKWVASQIDIVPLGK